MYGLFNTRAFYCCKHDMLSNKSFIVVAFLWNFFISKEAATAERRYEKERHSVKLHACKLHLVQGQICSHLSLPSPSPPLTPASYKCDKGGQLRLFPPPPPPPTYSPLLNLNSFQRPRPKARTASI